MPRATLFDSHGRARVFIVDLCPVHVMYGTTLFARQPGGDWEKDSTYKPTSLMRITDDMRADEIAPHPK